jgi:hypothetical protein
MVPLWVQLVVFAVCVVQVTISSARGDWLTFAVFLALTLLIADDLTGVIGLEVL